MQDQIDKRVAREANRKTRQVVVEKVESKVLTMQQGSDILGISVRHLQRVKERYARESAAGLSDKRADAPRTKRIGLAEA